MVVAEDDVAMVVANDGKEMVVAEDDLAMVLPEDGLAMVVVPDNDPVMVVVPTIPQSGDMTMPIVVEDYIQLPPPPRRSWRIRMRKEKEKKNEEWTMLGMSDLQNDLYILSFVSSEMT